MALERKKRDDIDKLFEELGILDLPDGVEAPFHDKWSEPVPSESEDPFAKFLMPKSENEDNKK